MKSTVCGVEQAAGWMSVWIDVDGCVDGEKRNEAYIRILLKPLAPSQPFWS